MAQDEFSGASDLVSFNRDRQTRELSMLQASLNQNSALVTRANQLNGVRNAQVAIETRFGSWGGQDNAKPTQYNDLYSGFLVTATMGQKKSEIQIKIGIDGHYRITKYDDGVIQGDTAVTPLQNAATNALNQWVAELGSKHGVDVILLGKLVQRAVDAQERAVTHRDRSPK